MLNFIFNQNCFVENSSIIAQPMRPFSANCSLYLGKMSNNKVECMLLHVCGSNSMSCLKNLAKVVEMFTSR